MMMRSVMLAAAAGAIAARSIGAQAAVASIAGSTPYAGAFSGYVAIVDLSSGRFAPVVTRRATGCHGDSTVKLLETREFAIANRTLLAITANAGPSRPHYQDGACGAPSGLIVSRGVRVNPPEDSGPVLYFRNSRRAAVTDRQPPAGLAVAVAGTTRIGNDCGAGRPGTLLVRNGKPGACAIPSSKIAAGRGAAGVDSTGRLLIVAVVGGADGTGLRTHEMAELLIAFGAYNAVNFDGGGSSTFYWTPGAAVPSLSARAAAMISRATPPHPDSMTFSATIDSLARRDSLDLAERPIYASFGLVYTPPPRHKRR